MNYTNLDYQNWSKLQENIRKFLLWIFQSTTNIVVDGLENVPESGAVIVAINHLHIIDTPLGITLLPRRVVVFAKEKWRQIPIVSWFLVNVGNAIFVGKSDSTAFNQAITVLKSGGMLGMAPEGTRSKNGKLDKGRSGISRMSIIASAPILPMVIYGHENIWDDWKKLKRPSICVKIGKLILPPIIPDEKSISLEHIRDFTELVMLELATLLPAQYRGSYGQKENL